MNSHCRTVTTIAASVLLGACSTARPLAAWQADLRPGDKVRVSAGDPRKTYSLRVTAVTPLALEGRKGRATRTISIPADQIAEVQLKELSVLKTVLLVGAGATLLLVLALEAAGPAFVLGASAP